MKKVKILALLALVLASVSFLSACSLFGGTVEKEVTKVMITLNATGGTGVTSNGWTWNESTGSYTKNCESEENFGTLPTTSREGFQFSGWYSGLESGTRILSTSKVPQTSKAYFAYWAEVTAIQLNLNGGTAVSFSNWVLENNMLIRSFSPNTVFGDLPVVTREGYVFQGWELSGEIITSQSLVPQTNTTYTAKWMTINFSNGDTYYQTLSQAIEQADSGDTIIIHKNISLIGQSNPILLEKNLTIMPYLNTNVTIDNGDSSIFVLGSNATLTLKGNGTGRLYLSVFDRSYDPEWTPAKLVLESVGASGTLVLQPGVFFNLGGVDSAVNIVDQRYSINVPQTAYYYTGMRINISYSVIDLFTNQTISTYHYNVSGHYGTQAGVYSLRIQFSGQQYYGNYVKTWIIFEQEIQPILE